MLLSHHLDCFLGAVKVEFIVLLSFLGMLLPMIIFRAVGLPLWVDAPVEGLVSETCAVILRFAGIVLHSWKEKLVAHWRVEAGERAVFVCCTALRVPLLSRIAHAVLH